MNKKVEFNIKYVYDCLYGFVIAFWILSIALLVIDGLDNLVATYIVNISCDLMGVLIILIMGGGILRERKLTTQGNAFLKMLFLLAVTLLVDEGCWLFDSVAGMQTVVRLLNTLFYCSGILMPLFFWEYIVIETNNNSNNSDYYNICNRFVAVIDILFILSNWWTEDIFSVDINATYNREGAYPVTLIAPFFIMSAILVYILKIKISFKEKLVYISYLIFPSSVIILQSFTYGLSLTYPASLISIILVYSNIYLDRSRKVLEQEKLLDEQGLKLMISQIQPHFIYNTLTTISNLCRKDPEDAEETTVMFSQYLRMNLDSLDKKKPVPFATELNHVRMYLSIEQKRFMENLNAEYHINSMNFMIPALSIQPIVENSVKHGIREKGAPGTVKISTYEDTDYNYVVIEDDGVGFDPSIPKNDGKLHVGMLNVKDRLKVMVNADVIVESLPGMGCKTTIKIPKDNC